MMTIKKSLAFLLVAVAGFAGGCTATDAAGVPSDVELQTYRVPEGYEDELKSMLRSALGRDEFAIGRADMGPGGTLVVVAPPGIQRGVRDLITQLNDMDVPPPGPTPVHLTYWLVVGRPAETGAPPVSIAGDAGLDAVRPALEQIASVEGSTRFGLLERLRLTSAGGDWAMVTGLHARIEQRATQVRDDVVSEIKIGLQDYSLKTEVKLRPGQFLVLGQAGYSGGQGPEALVAGNSDGLTLYYVITSTVE